ncbi:M90 family metallopeptidase [uncultured Dokdonia sp.]|uniref:M90 family metallopeptidase n=1 Tax=uncultured Dokdonia sp. TaxID=575653 RepID=UPI00260AC280|nr:M90 family metallopeptidase [uncultured Dokdonia sp.]
MAYIIPFVLFVFVLLLLSRKRKKEQPKSFPVHWHEILLKRVSFYKKRTKEQQQVFQKRMMLFLNEINIEAVQFELEELDTILIAASAVIPVFGFKEWHYNNLSTVLIYPDYFDENLSFDADVQGRKIAGLVGTGRFKNQMILSRKALHHGFTNATDKGNTAIHEFVHLLDNTDGMTDGIPERLLEHQYIAPWLVLMHKEMEAINNDASDIRSYGGTSQTEFFAVASEYFFERPDLFKRKHPELYEMLSRCFTPAEA